MLRAATLILALALGACASTPPPAARLSPYVESQLSVLKTRLFVLVEAERRRSNSDAKSLALDPELVNAAQIHSDDMAKKKSFDEDNPEGNPAVNRLLTNPRFRGFVGEISAAQYLTEDGVLDPEALARGFVDIWLKSPDHKMNLTYPGFDKTGIGVAINGNSIYVSELFATDLGLPEPR